LQVGIFILRPVFSHRFLGVERQRGCGCGCGLWRLLCFLCPTSSISHAFGYGCWVILTQYSRAYWCWVVPLRRGLRKHITRLHDQAGFLNNNVEKAIGLDFFPNDRPSSKVCKAYVYSQTPLFAVSLMSTRPGEQVWENRRRQKLRWARRFLYIPWSRPPHVSLDTCPCASEVVACTRGFRKRFHGLFFFWIPEHARPRGFCIDRARPLSPKLTKRRGAQKIAW